MYVVHSPTGSPHGPSRFEPCHTHTYLLHMYSQKIRRVCVICMYACMYACMLQHISVCMYVHVCMYYVCMCIDIVRVAVRLYYGCVGNLNR